MKNLLSYYLKKRIHIPLIISGIMIVFITVSISNKNFIYQRPVWNTNNTISQYVNHAENSPIGMLTVFSCILATLIPIFEFYFKMRKVSIDQLYSLPIKREKLYLTKYLIGLFELLFPLTIAYIWMLLMVVFKENMFNMGYMCLYYPVLMFMTTVVYTIVTFVYTRGNTVFDGLINILFYIFAAFVFMTLLYIWDINDYYSYFFLYSPHTCFNRIFINLTENDPSSYKNIDLISLLFYTIVAIIFFVLFIILNKKDKSENSMQTSDSLFSYRFMIPYYTIVCSGFAVDSAIALVFVFVGSYILYVTYKRSFKLTKKELLYLVILFSISIVFAIISNSVNN